MDEAPTPDVGRHEFRLLFLTADELIAKGRERRADLREWQKQFNALARARRAPVDGKYRDPDLSARLLVPNVARTEKRWRELEAADKFRTPSERADMRSSQVKASKARHANSKAKRAAAKDEEESRLAAVRQIEMVMREVPGASSSHRGIQSIWPVHAGSVRREPDAPAERLTDGKSHPVVVTKKAEAGS